MTYLPTSQCRGTVNSYGQSRKSKVAIEELPEVQGEAGPAVYGRSISCWWRYPLG